MTTGRINQVAFLPDVARRPRAAARSGAGAAVVRVIEAFRRGVGRESLPRGMHWVRERRTSPWATRPVTARWNTGGASSSSRARWRARDGGLTVGRSASPERVGSARTTRRGTIGPRSQPARGVARRQFGGRAQSQPAATTQTPLTRPHVPAGPTPPRQPRPASPWASEQVGDPLAPAQHRWA